MLLKLANLHSRLRINHDYDEIENLIFLINKFSAKFYFSGADLAVAGAGDFFPTAQGLRQ
ncbi:hypothetical protein ACFTAO_50895 [Paenibacillus rhizoplanae]